MKLFKNFGLYLVFFILVVINLIPAYIIFLGHLAKKIIGVNNPKYDYLDTKSVI